MPFISTAERVGIEKGLAMVKESLLAGIEELLDVKFAAPGLALVPEIREIEDLDLLRKILQSVKQADTPQALRQLWAKD